MRRWHAQKQELHAQQKSAIISWRQHRHASAVAATAQAAANLQAVNCLPEDPVASQQAAFRRCAHASMLIPGHPHVMTDACHDCLACMWQVSYQNQQHSLKRACSNETEVVSP